ncbi:hypothetical protein PoB_001454500 [Plakobranchus ocellatus]|uniref:Uncharacterized protein n=1 Tax=Plakobranchus ocellatus TaxID=259542 RepID=A0AAV3YXV8_9GAST|nr:hypothetical protein PoB_001454500 [Plakobranchus ocellatus]
MACPSDPVAKARYLEKIKTIGGRDFYKIAGDEFSFNLDELPEITYPDIFSYLVLAQSKYTADEFKAYKGLQAFNQANNGWVTNVAICKPHSSRNVLIMAKVD